MIFTSLNSNPIVNSDKNNNQEVISTSIENETDKKWVPSLEARMEDAPKPSMYVSSYLFRERFYESWDSLSLNGWTPRIVEIPNFQDFGLIYQWADATTMESFVRMQADSQVYTIPTVGTSPELMDDMAIESGNLINPDHPFGDGYLSLRFIPHNVKTYYAGNLAEEGINIITNPNWMQLLNVAKIQRNTFYVNYRTSPYQNFLDSGNNLYTYTKDDILGDPDNVPMIINVSLANIQITDYFELSIRATLYTPENYVDIDWVQIDSYNINITESKNQIGSNENQVINLRFLERYFQLNTNMNTMRLYYNVLGGPVSLSSPYVTATGSGNNFQFVLSHTLYEEGWISYRVYFTSTNNMYFYTTTLYFYCYDSEAPTFEGPITYDSTPEYQNGLTITAQLGDLGGSKLSSAILYFAYNATPVVGIYNFNPITQPSGRNFTITFSIPSESMVVGASFNFFIRIFDGRGNNATSNIFSAVPRDLIPPNFIFTANPLHWNSELNVYIGDLGYELTFNFLVNEPSQASGLEILTCTLNGSSVKSLPLNQGPHSVQIEAYDSYTRFVLIFYAKDQAGNEANRTYNVLVADTRAPDISEGANNTRDPDFDQNELLLDFFATEPQKAAGVNTNTYYFRYKINNTDWNYPIANNRNVTLTGRSTDLSFRFPRLLFEGYGTRLDYEFFVEDNDHNSRSINRTLFVVDRVKPTIADTVQSNYSIMYTFRDAKFVMNANDQVNASGIKNVTLYWMNGTDEFVFGDPSNLIFQPSSVVGSLYTFILEKMYIGGNGLSILIRVYDNAGNYDDWFKNDFLLTGTSRPTVLGYQFDYSNPPYINKNSSRFYLELNDFAYMTYSLGQKVDGDRLISKNVSTTFQFSKDGTYNVYVFYNDLVWENSIIVDRTAPSKVDSVIVIKEGKNHTISWSLPQNLSEAKPVMFRVYRGVNETFTLDQGVLIAETGKLSYSYEFDETGTYYYKVVVVDIALNLSELSPASDGISQMKSTSQVITAGITIASVSAISAIAIRSYRKKKFFGLDQKAPKNDTVSDKVQSIKKDLETVGNKKNLAKLEKKAAKAKKILPKELENVQNKLSAESKEILAESPPVAPTGNPFASPPESIKQIETPEKSKIANLVEDVVDDSDWG
jgi:hypothetical protein